MHCDSEVSSFDPDAALGATRCTSSLSCVEPRNPPVWPLAALNGRAPVVVVPTGAKARGIDLAYARNAERDLAKTYPLGSANGTPTHFMPTSTPVFCTSDGDVTYAGRVAHGYSVVVDHRNGWATYYGNLEHMFVTPTDRKPRRRTARVKSGDVLGFVGSLLPGGFKCLHFELWRRDDEGQFADVDPTRFMSDWLVLPWNQDHLTPSESAT